MPIPLQEGWLYGPVDSRRYGRSLGVNPLPVDRKLCSLDCLYCQYGFTRTQEVAGRAEVPSAQELKTAFREEFERLAKADDIPDRITVAGNGEPTLHPDFFSMSQSLAEARDDFFPGATLGLLCNGMHLHKPDVLEAIQTWYDEPAIKMEWGTPECFASLYQVSPKGYDRVLAGLEALDSFVVQALFVKTPAVDNSSDLEVAGWLKHLDRFKEKIRNVEIYSIDRPPADAAKAEIVGKERLEEIAQQAMDLGLNVEVFTR